MTELALALRWLADKPEGLLRWWWLALILFLVLAFLILFFTHKVENKEDQHVQMARRSAGEVEPVQSPDFETEAESLFSTPTPEIEAAEKVSMEIPAVSVPDELKLVEDTAPEIEAAEKGGIEIPVVSVPDDLKLIEGIGPKIDALLKQAGISTFAQLADTDVQRLRQVLDDARLRIADPTTWPQQARLAAEGKLDELKALQDSLTAGRKA